MSVPERDETGQRLGDVKGLRVSIASLGDVKQPEPPIGSLLPPGI